MKYKILKGTDLYNLLAAIQKKANDCHKASRKLAKSIGAIGTATTGTHKRAGGVDAFEFAYDKHPDKALWMQPDRHNNKNLFYPRSGKKYKANDDLHAKIKALPSITYEEYNGVIGFEPSWGNDLTRYKSYGLSIHEDFALVEVGEGSGYKPNSPDMREITVSEFNSLKKLIKE